MDIFNRKKIKELESRICDLEVDHKSIWAFIEGQTKELTRVEDQSYFKKWDLIPEDSMMHRIWEYLRAIRDYLGVRCEVTTEVIPGYEALKPPMREVFKLIKIKPDKSLREKK